MTETLQKARRGQLLPCAPCAVPGEADRLRAAEGIARAAVRRYRPLVRRWRVSVPEEDLRNVARAGVMRALREGREDTCGLYRGARHAVLAEIRRWRNDSRAVVKGLMVDVRFAEERENAEFYFGLVDHCTPERILIAREELRRVARGCVGARKLPPSWVRALRAAANGDTLSDVDRDALPKARRTLLCGT